MKNSMFPLYLETDLYCHFYEINNKFRELIVLFCRWFIRLYFDQTCLK